MMGKPPVGITPKYIQYSRRLIEIESGMRRYMDAKYLIPREWLDEYNDIADYLREREEGKRSDEQDIGCNAYQD